jgi:TM2 domain-containing membrane protein YozV
LRKAAHKRRIKTTIGNGMKKSTVAVLLSLLVFPGAGHVYLKRGVRALAFIVPTLAAGVYIIRQAFEQANKIVDQLTAGTLAVDPVAMAAQIEQSSGNTTMANVASAVLLICWLGATIDAWWLARQK